MRSVFDLTGADDAGSSNPYMPSASGGPGLYLNLDNLAEMVASRVSAAAEFAASVMAAAELGLRRVEPGLVVDLDDTTMLLSRVDESAGSGVAFAVRMARVRLSHDQLFTEATVALDVVGALPQGVRLGNLTPAAFSSGLAAEDTFARLRDELLTRLRPDRHDCAELAAHWRSELSADCMVLAYGGVVRDPNADEGELLCGLVGNRLYARRCDRLLAGA